MDKQLINEIVEYVYNLYEDIRQLHEIVRLGDQEIISRSDATKLMHYSAKYRQIFTVEFIKRTDGTKRVMNGMTGVRRYVNGRGMPYDNIAKGLMTVYDLKAPGSGAKKYRQVPLDSITRLKIKGRVFKVVDDAQYKNINKPFDSTADKETDVEPVKGMDTRSKDIKADKAKQAAATTDVGGKGKSKILTPINKKGQAIDPTKNPDIEPDGSVEDDDEFGDDERPNR